MLNKMTEGNPFKIILTFTLPLLVGNIFQQIYSISDVLIVGRTIGVNALAAVGATIPLFMLLFGTNIGLTGGFAVVTGQHFGAGDMPGMRRSVAVSITLATVYTAALMLLTNFCLDWGLKAVNVPDAIYQDAYSYIAILFYGIGSMTLYNLLASILRALGDSKTPLYFLILSTVLNVILCYAFIIIWHLGVPGSAIAVVISQTVAGLLCLYWCYLKFPALHLTCADWHFTWAVIYEHLRMGVPMAVQFGIMGFGILVLQAVCNSFGPETIAGFVSATRVEQIALQPMISVGLGVSAYTAQNYGARNFQRIKQGVRSASLLLLGFSAVAALTVYAAGNTMIRIFIDNASNTVIAAGVEYLGDSVPFYFFLSQIFVYRNACTGLGVAIMPLVSSAAELVMRSGIAIYFAKWWGYTGMCYASPLAWIGAALLLFGGYRYFYEVLRRKYSKV